ncbi:hypothetical protein RHGRI_037172 [Rhododendron griersonianum]|uniref:Ubiquinol oxidase n=1 Tax=Rhododendron griersonianum TaxID=479676 RepID=A0AAV6HR87_9ERIC|nr:hypothetical protein RHGRI_037172 [Rhododendron griersonianum]
MAVSLSSTVYTTTVSASASSIKEGAHRKSCSLTKQIPFSFTPLSSRPRKLFRVQATVLQEDDEKVAVEESFQPKSICDDDGKETLGESSESSSSSGLESWVIKLEQSVNVFLTDSVIKILDTLYHDRDYARFFVLETIARVPYFAFISVLHLYESFGWWRRADYLKVHFAESWNEMHHLLIMEELGGNAWWFDRFLAQHIAVFYYFMIVFMYALSPRMAYHFSECVESHAFETYDKFIKAQGENLYDVFVNIREDEGEHCKTMKACQIHGNLRSPHSFQEDTIEDDSGCIPPRADCEGIVDCMKKSFTSPQAKE